MNSRQFVLGCLAKGLLRLGFLLLIALLIPTHCIGQTVTLAWDPNPEPDLAGYRLYGGTESGGERLLTDVGNKTTAVVTNLVMGVTNYFYVTAYNTSGVESIPSNEISYRVPPLAEVLNAPGLVWTSSTDVPSWYGQTGTSRDGVSAARSGAIGANQASWVETSVMGPGSLSFWWKVSSETNYDYLRVRVGGVEKAKISGEAGWLLQTVAIPAGWQSVRWTYAKDQYVVKGLDAAWLDQVSYAPSLGLADVLNTPGWTWVTGGNTPAWYGQTTVSKDGFAGARSGAIGNSQTNWITTTVTGPGTLSFWWKVSSEVNYDYLRFSVGGVEKAKISGEVNWVNRTFAIPSGVQTLQWAYTKDTYVVSGLDAAWLDQVSFLPGVSLAGAPVDTPVLVQGRESTPTRFLLSQVPGSAAILLSLSGEEGDDYRLEASTNLIDWSLLARVTVGAGGTVEFQDSLLEGTSMRFYRWQRVLGAPNAATR